MLLNLITFLLQNVLFLGSDELKFLLSLQQLILVTQMIGLLVLDQYVVEFSKLPERSKTQYPSSVLICMLALIPVYMLFFYYNLNKHSFSQFLNPMPFSAGVTVFVFIQAIGLLFSQIAQSQNRIILSYVANMPTGLGMFVGTLVYYSSDSTSNFLYAIIFTSLFFSIFTFRQFYWSFHNVSFRHVGTLVLKSLYVRGGHNIHNIVTPMYVVNFASISADAISILNSKRVIDMIVNALLSVYSKRLMNQYLLIQERTLQNYLVPPLFQKILYSLGGISIVAAIFLWLFNPLTIREACVLIGCAFLFNIILLTEARYTLINIINSQIRFIYLANIAYVLVLLGFVKLLSPTLLTFWFSLTFGQMLILIISRFGAVKING